MEVKSSGLEYEESVEGFMDWKATNLTLIRTTMMEIHISANSKIFTAIE